MSADAGDRLADGGAAGPSAGIARLESTIGEVLRFGTITSSTMFVIGLLMTLTGYHVAVAGLLLNAGLILLLATPPARVLVSVVEYIRERDWAFVALTLIVLLALGGSLFAAYF